MDPSGSLQFPPVSSSGKPSLSKPRLVKVRKNAHRKPASLGSQEPDADSGFNPFRSETVEERIGRWSPFVPEPESMVLESSNANLSRTSSVISEGELLTEHESEMGRSFSFGSDGRGDSSTHVFVTGDSSLGLDERLAFSKPMDVMSRGRVDCGKQAENVFVFGGSSVKSQENADPLFSSASFRSEGPDPVDFVLGSGVRKGADPSQDSSLGSDESSFTKLAEATRKLNLNNLGNVDDFERKNKQAEHVFVSGGSRLNKPSEGSTVGSTSLGSNRSGTSSLGYSMPGSGVSKGWNSSLDLEETSFSVLADQTRKLNLNNPANVDDFEKKKQQAQSSFPFGGSKNAAGSSAGENVNKLSDSAGFTSFGGFGTGSNVKNTRLQKPAVGSASLGSNMNDDLDTFVLGSRVNNDEGLFTKLPEKIKNLNLSNGDEIGKSKSAENVFVFGGSKYSTGSFGCGDPMMVPEENSKLNVEKEAIGNASDSFAFGSNAEKGSFSNRGSTTPFTSFHKGTTSNLPNDKKLSTEKVNVGDSFMFGDGGNASTSSGGSAFNTVHEDLEKLNIGSKTAKFTGSTSYKPIFQEGNQDPVSNTGYIPSFGSTSTFLGKPGGLEIPHMEFKTPHLDASWLTKESLFMEKDQNVPFSVKKCDAKSLRAKKKMGNSKQPVQLHQSLPKHFVQVESESYENPEVDPCGTYSPMDCSPYREDTIADECSREPSVTSDDSVHLSSPGASIDSQRSISIDEREEVLVSAAERLNIHEDEEKINEEEVGVYGVKGRSKRSLCDDSASVDEQYSGLGKSDGATKHDEIGSASNFRTAPMEAKIGFFNSNVEGHASKCESRFTTYSSLEDIGESNLTFAGPASVRGPFSTSKWIYSRSRSRSSQNPPVSTSNASCPLDSSLPDLIPRMSSSRLPDSAGISKTSSIAHKDDESTIGKSTESEIIGESEESTSTASVGVAARAACEKWRFRGNQAYASGLLSKAEDCYTRGISSVSLREIPSSCIQPLTLCYSNRAATRMSLGRMRDALRDCKMAASIDPDFLKARVRAGNCHLALGEIGEALMQFEKCLQPEKGINTNQKYLSEAADGLQKVQQVRDLTSQAAELLPKRTWTDASRALNLISEALSVSPHSESLLEMKAKALLMMGNYEEVINLCEQTLHLAEQNSFTIEADSQDCSEYMKTSSPKLWRAHLVAKSHFYVGKLEEALELLQKHEEMKAAVDKSESSMSFADIIHELIRLKFAGNEAFQSGRHSEAVEYYTAALACSAESRPFTAVCFCNRAAAYQALGQITDAIADCSLAIALDGSYPKAISRRATLHEMIRDYGQAANDLNRLVSLLEKQVVKVSQSGEGKSTTNGTDLKRARARLAAVEEEGRKEILLNMYMILGIEPSSSAADVKKAYRKAALRHHPDKAGQFFVKNENVDDGLWKEVAAEVQADADRLFKMIGEAYTILSDPTKRLQYDEEDDMRTTTRRGYYASNYGSATPKTSSDAYSSYYDKNGNRRQWRTHGSSYQQ